MSEPFFTVGHSTHPLEEFLEMMAQNHVTMVIDVRRLPGSRRHPQFDQEALSCALGEAGLEYRHVAALTGRRNVSTEVPFEVNAWWTNRSFHNYADHALTSEFSHALDELRAWGHDRRTAVMCSEAVWWRCHRRIIADHLLVCGEHVRHIMGVDHVEEARLSDGAVLGDDGRLTYPPD